MQKAEVGGSETCGYVLFCLVCPLQNSKVRRFAFELKMQDKSTFLLAAESEAEMEEWIGTLNKILHSSFEQAMQEKRNGDLHDGEPWTSCAKPRDSPFLRQQRVVVLRCGIISSADRTDVDLFMQMMSTEKQTSPPEVFRTAFR